MRAVLLHCTPSCGLWEPPLFQRLLCSIAHHSRLPLPCHRGQVDTVVRLISTSAHTGALALLVRFRALQPAACTGSPAAGNTCLHYVACHRLALALPDLPTLQCAAGEIGDGKIFVHPVADVIRM